MVKFWIDQIDMRHKQCHAILGNQKLMRTLLELNYDAVLADASVPCGEIIAAKLNLTLMYTVRTLPGELQFYLSQVNNDMLR